MVDGQEQHGDCPEIIPPGSWGAVYLPANANAEPGTYQEDLRLSLSGREILLRVDYELRRVETGCGCHQSGAAGEPAVLVLLLAGFVSFRGRKRGSGCR
jgi:hypothetical protein